MGVAKRAVIVKTTLPDGVGDLAVGIPERYAGLYQVVDLLHAERQLVLRVAHHIGDYLHPPDGIFNNVEAVVQFLEDREEDLLQDLHVAEVAAREIAGDEADGVRHALELVAVCPHQLEHIRILLVRHDAGACGQRVRQVDEAEVLAGEQAAVHREPPDGLGD